jgi:hypothetical protein
MFMYPYGIPSSLPLFTFFMWITLNSSRTINIVRFLWRKKGFLHSSFWNRCFAFLTLIYPKFWCEITYLKKLIWFAKVDNNLNSKFYSTSAAEWFLRISFYILGGNFSHGTRECSRMNESGIFRMGKRAAFSFLLTIQLFFLASIIFISFNWVSFTLEDKLMWV